VWLNEFHADFLARDRLAEARADAARRDLLRRLRRPPRLRRVVASTMIRLARRLAGARSASQRRCSHGYSQTAGSIVSVTSNRSRT
jgi:hypothetical protein